MEEMNEKALTTLSTGDKNDVVKCIRVISLSESEIFANVKTNKYDDTYICILLSRMQHR